MNSRKIQSFAKGLVGVSLGADGLVDGVRVSAIVDILKENYGEMDLKDALVAYLRELERFIARTRLKIEHCGRLSDGGIGAIKSHFEGIFGRKLHMDVCRSDDLISGIRVTAADFVVERSIAATLDGYKKSLRTS
jgi:F0F1-type ATP synthase delta subunit